MTGVLTPTLLITITVTASSLVRWAPNTLSESGFDDEVVFTLTSPNVDLLPS